MSHVMLDIETLGTQPGSVIIQIGAVAFNPKGFEIDQDFFANVDIESSIRAGLKVDAGAITFWMRETSDQARASLFVEPFPLDKVLGEFYGWWGKVGGEFLWSHGSNFDTVLLDAAYRLLKKRPPWKYKDVRDTRTLFAVAPGYWSEPDPKQGVVHNALDDARNQARWVQRAYRLLGLKEQPT